MRRFLAVVALVSLSALGLWADVAPVGGVGGTALLPLTGGVDPWYSFTASDGVGDMATGWVSGSTSVGADGLLVTSGQLNVTAGPLLGTYFLDPTGPSPTIIGGFEVDDVIYPLGDAAGTTPPSYLTEWGLLFNGGGTAINLWGNGRGDYAFYSEGTIPSAVSGGGTFSLSLPEPGTILLLSLMGTLGLGLPSLLRRRSR
jgi:hypothetical protein